MSTLMMMMGGTVLVPSQQARAQDDIDTKLTTPPVKCGVIGCGVWGRDIINTLGQHSNAPITAICDTYPAYLRRGARAAPDATKYADYKQLLADKNVEAVLVATPTHLHRQIVEESI